ncbi:hypothetical protein BJY21_002436 [Kineosphaera limosa]|uniref:cell wall-binding repeat-containing protein n=1 Tax=Kineosphaera limosa TaxID=111564 RepID=UPI0014615809|nr:cell wall-binding repeat-containing protein [Kineosphaera limosa]NYE01252.1 hypothetical protein [Kineosphaera limosa]
MSGTRPLDAVAYGKDATPTLYVPPRGAVPDEVGAAYRLVRPSVVEVIGSEAQLPTTQVRAVIGAARFQRLRVTDASRVTWSAAVRAAAWGNDESFTDMPPVAFVSPRVVAEAAAAAQVRNWFGVVVPRSGSLPVIPVYPTPTFTTTAAVVGGASTLAAAQRAVLLRGHPGLDYAEFNDIAGQDRYDTSADVAYLGFYAGARTAYIVNGVGDADAAATVSLVDGPVLLVPPCGPGADRAKGLLLKLRPQQIVTIGDRTAVCDDMLGAQTFDPQVPEEEPARDIVQTSTATCLLDNDGDVDCWGRNTADPRQRVPLAPLTWTSQASGVARITRGLDKQLCAYADDGAVSCWPVPSARGGEATATTVFPASAGIVEYQVGGDPAAGQERACGLGRDGRIWCHSRGERPQVRLALGTAVGIAVGHTSCLLRSDHSIWCWTQSPEGPTGRPTRLAVDIPAEQIALSRHGLLVRRADGAVMLVPASRLAAPDGPVEARVVAEASQRLLPGTDGCLIDADGRVDCPLEPAARRTAYRQLTTGGVLAFTRDERGGCAVRADGSATCRSDAAPGTWGALGDGLWAPRYRPAEVLGHGRMQTFRVP